MDRGNTWHLVDVVVDFRGRYHHTTDGTLHGIGGVRYVIPRVPCCYEDRSWRAALYHRAHSIGVNLMGIVVPSPRLTIAELAGQEGVPDDADDAPDPPAMDQVEWHNGSPRSNTYGISAEFTGLHGDTDG